MIEFMIWSLGWEMSQQCVQQGNAAHGKTVWASVQAEFHVKFWDKMGQDHSSMFGNIEEDR
jgi:hypothetical protein